MRFQFIVFLFLPVDAGAASMTVMERARAGDFSAEAEVPCAQEVGQALSLCTAGVARDGSVAVVAGWCSAFVAS